jgi:SAM-dependent methyltransferase
VILPIVGDAGAGKTTLTDCLRAWQEDGGRAKGLLPEPLRDLVQGRELVLCEAGDDPCALDGKERVVVPVEWGFRDECIWEWAKRKHEVTVCFVYCSDYMRLARLLVRERAGVPRHLSLWWASHDGGAAIQERVAALEASGIDGIAVLRLNTDDAPARIDAACKTLDDFDIGKVLDHQKVIRVEHRNWQAFEIGDASERWRWHYRRRCDVTFPQDMTGMTVCDMGTNVGAMCVEALNRGAALCHAIDLHEENVEFIRAYREAWKLPISTQVADMQKDAVFQPAAYFDNGRKYDYGLLLNCLHYTKDPSAVLREAFDIAHRVIAEVPVRVVKWDGGGWLGERGWADFPGARWPNTKHTTVRELEAVAEDGGYRIARMMPSAQCAQRLVVEFAAQEA